MGAYTTPGLLMVLLVFFGSGLAFLFALGQFVRRPFSRRRLVPAAFFLSLSIVLLHAALYHGRVLALAPHVFLVNVPFLFFAGPLLAGYIRAVGTAAEDRAFRPVDLFHLVPGITAAAYLAPVFTSGSAEKIALAAATRTPAYPTDLRVLFSLALLTVVAYTAYAGVVLVYLVRSPALDSSNRRPLLILLGLFFICGALANAAFLLRSVLYVQLVYGTVALTLLFLHLAALRYPDLMLTVRTELRRRSELFRLKGVNLPLVERELERLMSHERLYRDEELSLQGLAAALSRAVPLSPEQLSQFLNARLGKSFHGYVNDFRIREATEILSSRPEETVLAVAYSVGFASPSSFHEAFRRQTGTTPGVFRRRERSRAQ